MQVKRYCLLNYGYNVIICNLGAQKIPRRQKFKMIVNDALDKRSYRYIVSK